MNNPVEQTIACSQCDTKRPLSEMVTQRPLPDTPDTFEVGCLCPNCGLWTHSYYVTPRLVQWQGRINKAAAEFQRLSALYKAQRGLPSATSLFLEAQHAEKLLRGSERGYAKVFEESNAELRKRFGTKSPTQILQEAKANETAVGGEGGGNGGA